jgi:hypothetical protein
MKKQPEKELTVRDRINFGSGEPIGEVFEQFSSDSDQALKSARTLFEADDENIRLRTDLSDHEIKLLTKLRIFHRITDLEELDSVLTEFMMLKVSRNRKSRAEFVDTVKVKQEQNGFMGRMFGRH